MPHLAGIADELCFLHALQADNNDTYRILSSVDGTSWSSLHDFPPPGGWGLRTSTWTSPSSVQAQYIQIVPVGGDHLYSVSELQIFANVCEADSDCDDSNPCTVDTCNANGLCDHPAGNAGAVCRPAAGPCDVAEMCNGSDAQCPDDQLEPAGTACREAKGACDATDTCDGSSAECKNIVVPDGSTCEFGKALSYCECGICCDPVHGCPDMPCTAQ